MAVLLLGDTAGAEDLTGDRGLAGGGGIDRTDIADDPLGAAEAWGGGGDGISRVFAGGGGGMGICKVGTPST